jgi:hypothetical protein
LYFDEKIVFILRRKEGSTERDNGVWVAMLPERTESVLADFPNLRKIEMFGGKVFGGWLNLPETDEEFEGTAMELCRLVSRGDARIGKIPKAKKKKRA